jgi:hypothetical protein
MSASDAAPLPRLGEVFFDVRGSSRSMRLSWYADTGVAVFSIWQGGMCTGTFRLPIGDLPRMIEILERGPDEPRSRSRSREQIWGGREPAGTGQREVPGGRSRYPDQDPDGQYQAEPYPDGPATGYSQDAAETAVSYVRDERSRPPRASHRSRADRGRADHGRADHGRADRGRRDDYDLADTGAASSGRDRGEFPPAGGTGYGEDRSYDDEPSYPGRQYRSEPGYAEDGRYAPEERYGRDEAYGREEFASDPYSGYQPLTAREADSGGHRRDDDGYGQERFVPPYVRGAVSDYSGDIPPRRADRPAEPMPDAYRGGPPAGPGGQDEYLRPSWPPPGYSDGPDYHLAGPGPQHSPGRHGKYPGEPPSADDRPDPEPAGDVDWEPGDYPAWPDR